MRNIAADTVGEPAVNITIFVLFVVVTLVIVARAARNNRTAADYYAAGRGFTGPQNGLAISGDYLSAASFLGIAGAIALNGYDGFLYSIGFLVAWLVALLLVAELGGQRVQLPVGEADVEERDQERRDELQQAEHETDRDVPPELVRHEVVRVVGQQDEEEVPGEERGGEGEDDAAVPPSELLEPLGVLDLDIGTAAHRGRVGPAVDGAAHG